MRLMAHTQIIMWLSTLPLFQPGCSQDARIWTTARILDQPSLDGFQPGLFKEGRNEARGRAPEASADLIDFHLGNVPGLAPPSQEGTSTSSPRSMRGSAAFSPLFCC